MNIQKNLIPLLILVFPLTFWGQCPDGQIEISLDLQTDNWGYEIYWEIVAVGDNCGQNTIASGGNANVGCNGGGAQNQTPGGYGDNETYSEGPWCVDEGLEYHLIYVDDWGDGGADFVVNIDGFPLYAFDGSGTGNTWTFEATGPPALDCGVLNIESYGYVTDPEIEIEGHMFNFGSGEINELEIQYSVDGGAPVVQTLSDLAVEGYHEIAYSFDTPATLSFGEQEVTVTILSVNGTDDEVSENNSTSKTLVFGNGIPNVIDGYLGVESSLNIVNGPFDDVSYPRDLDFHPYLNRFELWVTNTGTENSGGSTVTFYDAGFGDQTSEWRQDGNAWHFMSLPTAISFGENQNFATASGVYDANHDGGTPFTGPALWSSDPEIYAQPSGGNGSHLDMLHASPYCQGIAHEVDNAYWVVDGYSGDIVMYDFAEDHGPGNSFHGDATIHRYADVLISKDPNDHVVSHCAYHKDTDWLYVVDYGGQRVLRINTNSGTPGGTPTFGPFEAIEEYKYIEDYEWEDIVTEGLVEPAGIDVIGDRMIVSDYATGDIVIYDITASPVVELDRIETGSPGIMGIKIGPWGRIWFVNADTDEVGFVEGNPLVVHEDLQQEVMSLFPNPANDVVNIDLPDAMNNALVRVMDIHGREIAQHSVNLLNTYQMDVSGWSDGLYLVSLIEDGQILQTSILSVK